MPESELDIVVNAEASGAVAGFDNLGNAVEGFNGELGKLGETFSRPLEHVGVHLFGRELLTTVGLGREARPILGLLQTGVNELAGAFGIAAGAAGLFTFGLVAAAAIAYKLYEAYEKHHEGVEKLLDDQEKALAKSLSLTNNLGNYRDAVGSLPPELERLRKATEDLTAAQQHQATVTAQQLVKTLEEQVATNERLAKANSDVIAGTRQAADAFGTMFSQETLDAAAKEKSKKITEELALAHATLAQKLASARADLQAFAHGYAGVDDQLQRGTKAINDQKKAIDDWAREQNKAIDEALRAEEKHIKSQDHALQKSIQAFGGMKSGAMDYEAAAGKVAQSVGDGFGQSFAKMVVEGQDFASSMVEAFKNMAEQFIAAVASMMVKWLAFLALKEATGGGFVSLGSFMGGFAMGTDTVVDGPTMMMVGEGGEPERVSVTPLSQGGGASGGGAGGGGGGSVVYNIGPFVANGNDRPQEFAQRVLQYLMQQTRGRGQIQPKGASIY